ncbi:spatacsin isoform X2 [Lampetra fluviatilis]
MIGNGQCLEVSVWCYDREDDGQVDLDEGDNRENEDDKDVEERGPDQARVRFDAPPARAISHGTRGSPPPPPFIAVLASSSSSSSSSSSCGRHLRLVVTPHRSSRPRIFTVSTAVADFLWECEAGEAAEGGGSNEGGGVRLVSTDEDGAVTLHELQRDDDGGDWVMARPRTCQASQLMEYLGLHNREDAGEHLCLRLLSFVDGVATVLLRGRLLARLLWLADGCHADGCWADVQLQCTLLPTTTARDEPADVRLCLQKLLALHADGQIYIYSTITGVCVGAIDLTLILPSPPSGLDGGTPFGFLRPSDDLGVIVAVDASLRAVCVSPVDYFRRFPDHMFQGSWLEDPHTSSQEEIDELDEDLDEDDVERAFHAQLPFNPDRSWEAQLERLHASIDKAYGCPRQPGADDGVKDPAREKTTEFSSAEASSCDGGNFEQNPGLCFARLLEPVEQVESVTIFSICNTSVLFAIGHPNGETNGVTVVLWQFSSGILMTHNMEGPCIPVEMEQVEHPCLLVKGTGLSMVLFGIGQDELLKRLMIHSGVGVVDAVCDRNNWTRCSIPIHALEAALKNRQLDTVDFFLKSQENLFDVREGQTTLTQLKGLQDLVPALEVLRHAVAGSSADASSQPFAEQLLHRALGFLHTQLRRLYDPTPSLDQHQQKCAQLLMGFLIELRQYMRRYPWRQDEEEEEEHGGGGGGHAGSGESDEEILDLPGTEHWDELPTDEVIRDAVLTNQIPMAQAWLRVKGHGAWRLGPFTNRGLHLAHCALQGGDLAMATKLIFNMGFDTTEQLRNICCYTLETNLRDFLVEKLIEADSLTRSEITTAEFVRRVESLYAPRTEDDDIGKGSARSSTNIWGLAVAEGSRDALLERVTTSGQATTGEVGIMLDWAYRWDDVTRQRILLDRHAGTDKAVDKDSTAYSPEVLWSFLTSRNDGPRLGRWATASAGGVVREAAWPDLPVDMSYGCSLCSLHLRDAVLDEMARRGCFVPAEASDLERLVVRLSRTGGLMQPIHPLTLRKEMADRALVEGSRNGADPPAYSAPRLGEPSDVELFHDGFIRYCVESELRHLLYAYLHYYRLEQSSGPSVLSDEALRAAHPWFDLLLHIFEIQHLSHGDQQPADTRALYLASLANAQMVLPSSQAGVSSMLTEGRTLLAPATLLYSPGGLDGGVSQVDGQLLRLALSRFPKLRAALFPQQSTHGLPFPDVSLYHLLQALTPFDPSRLYGWQEANSLAAADAASELPHFSLPSLASRHSTRETLGFTYFLLHGRPAYAFASFLAWRLERGSLSSRSLVRASEEAYTLALVHFDSPAVPAACVAFLELLAVPTARVRVDVRAARLVSAHLFGPSEHAVPTADSGSVLGSDSGSVSSAGRGSTSGVSSVSSAARDLEARELLHSSLVGRLVELVHSVEPAVSFLLGELESAIALGVEEAGLDSTSLKAGREWDLVVHFCRGHGVALTEVYPRACATAEQWLPFLAFVHHHAYPVEQVKTLINGFGPALRSHLLLAFSSLRGWSKVAESPDLFGVLIESLASPRPCAYLLSQAVSHRAPVLGVLAAGLQDAQPVRCLCAWIAASAADPSARSAWAQAWDAAEGQPEEGPGQEMAAVWGLCALSGLVQDCLGRRLTHVLISGFQLFLPKCPFQHLLHMFELCMEQKDYSCAKLKLQDFIRDLDDLKVLCPHGDNEGVSVEWLETQASMLLLLLIERSDTPYQLHRLFRLLSKSQRILKSTVHDFTALSELLEILRGSGVCVAPSVLAEFSAEALRADCVRITASLQDRGLFTQAKQVAALVSLPVGDMVVNEIIHSIGTMKDKSQWQEPKVRVYFWKRCHSTFEDITMSPRKAAEFFKTQASELSKWHAESDSKTPDAHSRTGTATELVYEELCLLTLSGHWLGSDKTARAEELEATEKRCWFHKIRLLLSTGRSLRPTLSRHRIEDYLETDVLGLSQTIAKFCFSDHALLNEPLQLSLKRLPSLSESIVRSQDEPVNFEKDPTVLDVHETQALRTLVNQSLDASKISEAVRVCRYFGLSCFDVRLAMGCLALARGEESVESLPTDILSILTSDGDTPTARHRSLSVSSTSSFVLVPSEEENGVARAISALAGACTFGGQFCRQVLNAYELAKDLGRDFASVLSGDGEALIRDVLSSERPDRVARARMLADTRRVPAETIATLLAGIIERSLLSVDSPGKESTTRPVYRSEEGKQGFLQLLKLCADPPALGMKLMTASAKLGGGNKSACVELLLLAHECFTIACHMEGIVEVLRVAKHLTHHCLVPAKEYNLMVRLLVEIGRYTEMTYILDILNQNHQFELLLRKKGTSDGRLKAALLKYIRQQHPGDSEKYNMVVLCFSMSREIAENLEGAARTRLKLIAAQPWEVTPELKSTLEQVLTFLKDAAESYKKESCMRQALSCVRLAKLVRLQLHMLASGQKVQLINLQGDDLARVACSLPKYYQVATVADAYGYKPRWAEVLHHQVVQQGNFSFFDDFKSRGQLESPIIQDVVNIYRKVEEPSAAHRDNMKKLLRQSWNACLCLTYSMAFLCDFRDLAGEMLAHPGAKYYLNDTLASYQAGRLKWS